MFKNKIKKELIMSDREGYTTNLNFMSKFQHREPWRNARAEPEPCILHLFSFPTELPLFSLVSMKTRRQGTCATWVEQ